jgi:hypothetical protein
VLDESSAVLPVPDRFIKGVSISALFCAGDFDPGAIVFPGKLFGLGD